MTLAIGGGFVGYMRKLKIFLYPKTMNEASLNVREANSCIPFGDQLCS